jgi:ABC-type sugar transport system substrate-binding protein
MKKLSKILSLVLALVMCLALVSCGGGSSSGGATSDAATSGAASGSSDSSSASGGQSGATAATGAQDGCNVDLSGVDLSGKTLGYVTITSTAPWGGRVGTEFERMAKEAGATVKTLDANTNADDVITFCRQMIDAGVDGLAVFGGDPTGMVDIAKECSEAGIPLFLCGLDVAEEGREYATACIGPDQEQAFVDIAKKVIEDNGTTDELNVVQISGVPFLMDYQLREAGFSSGMSEASNYNLYEPDYAFSSRTDAKSFMEQHIQADGDKINIVMGYDDDLTMGAVDAINEAGMTGSIKVYSFTGQNDAIQAVKDGKMELTVMNRADDIAAETCVAMNEYFSTGSTEYYHYTDLIYITADNVDQYLGKGEF